MDDDVRALLLDLLSQVRLLGNDPDLVTRAELVVRARQQLTGEPTNVGA